MTARMAKRSYQIILLISLLAALFVPSRMSLRRNPQVGERGELVEFLDGLKRHKHELADDAAQATHDEPLIAAYRGSQRLTEPAELDERVS